MSGTLIVILNTLIMIGIVIAAIVAIQAKKVITSVIGPGRNRLPGGIGISAAAGAGRGDCRGQRRRCPDHRPVYRCSAQGERGG